MIYILVLIYNLFIYSLFARKKMVWSRVECVVATFLAGNFHALKKNVPVLCNYFTTFLNVSVIHCGGNIKHITHMNEVVRVQTEARSWLR